MRITGARCFTAFSMKRRKGETTTKPLSNVARDVCLAITPRCGRLKRSVAVEITRQSRAGYDMTPRDERKTALSRADRRCIAVRGIYEVVKNFIPSMLYFRASILLIFLCSNNLKTQY